MSDRFPLVTAVADQIYDWLCVPALMTPAEEDRYLKRANRDGWILYGTATSVVLTQDELTEAIATARARVHASLISGVA